MMVMIAEWIAEAAELGSTTVSEPVQLNLFRTRGAVSKAATGPAEDRAHRLSWQQSPRLSPRVASLRPAEMAHAVVASGPARRRAPGEKELKFAVARRRDNRRFARAIFHHSGLSAEGPSADNGL